MVILVSVGMGLVVVLGFLLDTHYDTEGED